MKTSKTSRSASLLSRLTYAALTLSVLCWCGLAQLSARPAQKGRLDLYVFTEALIPSDHVTFTLSGPSERRVIKAQRRGLQIWLPPGRYQVLYSAGSSEAEPQGSFSVELTAQQSVEVIMVDHPPPRGPQIEIESAQAIDQVGAAPLDAQGAETPVARRLIKGRVLSEVGAEPVGRARVFIRGDLAQTQTDAQGRFELSAPAADVRLTVLHGRFATQHYSLGADHPEGESLSIYLQTQQNELEESVIILPRIDQSSVLAQLERRKGSVSVSDSLSLDDIKKSADSNASAATRRIVGATVVGGAYLNVRGLGGRYTSVRLNGVTLPSTDPDLPGFQIDLFPVSLLTSLQIDKTFRPSIPGNFAGGSMDIQTRDFSEEDELSFSLSLSSDTQSFLSASAVPSQRPGDWLGLGSSGRQLPSGFPNQRVARSRNGLDQEAITAAGQRLPVDWEGQDHTLLPNLSLGFRYSGSRRGLIGQRLGYLFTLGYRNESTLRSGLIANVKLEGAEDARVLSLRESLDRQRARLSSKLGALGAVSLKLTDWDELRFVSVLTQTGDNQWTEVEGISESEGLPIRQNQLQYIQRQLLFNQLIGSHEDIIADLDLSWRVNHAGVRREQPDSRDVLYIKTEQGYAYRNVTGSGERLFSGLSQSNLGGALDLSAPLPLGSQELELKLGGAYQGAERAWSARRFGTQIVTGSQEDRLVPPNQFFARDRYGEAIDLVELTRSSDGYENQSQLWAGYLSSVGKLRGDLKFMLGARYEAFSQEISVASPFAQGAEAPQKTERQDQDILPALSLIYSPWSQANLRFSYGGTVARPLVRELAPFLQQDFVRRRTITGNPDLKRTWIDNYDLRFEWFPSEAEVVAVSLFAKQFDAPIESIIKDQNGNLGFENTPQAENAGLELEMRLQLKRWSAMLTPWQLLGNLTWTRSRVTLSEEQAGFVTSKSRPLQGQSPYVANLGLSYEPNQWSANLFYNVFGPRILDVGMFGIPDVYERPFHSLDFTLSWTGQAGLSLGLSVQNLLMQKMRLEQGRFPYREVDPGLKLGLRLGYQATL